MEPVVTALPMLPELEPAVAVPLMLPELEPAVTVPLTLTVPRTQGGKRHSGWRRRTSGQIRAPKRALNVLSGQVGG